MFKNSHFLKPIRLLIKIMMSSGFLGYKIRVIHTRKPIYILKMFENIVIFFIHGLSCLLLYGFILYDFR